jgi:hypothetical protein
MYYYMCDKIEFHTYRDNSKINSTMSVIITSSYSTIITMSEYKSHTTTSRTIDQGNLSKNSPWRCSTSRLHLLSNIST